MKAYADVLFRMRRCPLKVQVVPELGKGIFSERRDLDVTGDFTAFSFFSSLVIRATMPRFLTAAVSVGSSGKALGR
jgi:hypothetical protein